MVKGSGLTPVKLPGILGAVWNGTETQCSPPGTIFPY